MAQAGNLIIVSGPSGAGKSILVSRILETVPRLKFSVSYTTRAPRGKERDGVEYYFVDAKRFHDLIASGELLEWAEVYGNFYGTSEKLIDETVAQGSDVLLDIDVQGARTVRNRRPSATSVFIMPPLFETLKVRLGQRKLDKEYVIEQRLKIAREEIEHYASYDYLIINEELSRSVEELQSIVLAARCRISNRAESAKAILVTFGGMDAECS